MCGEFPSYCSVPSVLKRRKGPRRAVPRSGATRNGYADLTNRGRMVYVCCCRNLRRFLLPLRLLSEKTPGSFSWARLATSFRAITVTQKEATASQHSVLASICLTTLGRFRSLPTLDARARHSLVQAEHPSKVCCVPRLRTVVTFGEGLLSNLLVQVVSKASMSGEHLR